MVAVFKAQNFQRELSVVMYMLEYIPKVNLNS